MPLCCCHTARTYCLFALFYLSWSFGNKWVNEWWHDDDDIVTGNDDGCVATAERRRVERDVALVATGVISRHPGNVQRMVEEVERLGRRRLAVQRPCIVDRGRSSSQSVPSHVHCSGRAAQHQVRVKCHGGRFWFTCKHYTQTRKNFPTSPINNVATLPCKNLKVELSSSRASSTRPLISGGQGWGHVFVPVDSTLNMWLVEITVSVERFCFLQGHFFVRTSNLKANIHIIPLQFVENSYGTLRLCKVVWRRYLGEVGKLSSYFVANLSKTLHINFYRYMSSIVEVITKKCGVFLCLTVYIIGS